VMAARDQEKVVAAEKSIRESHPSASWPPCARRPIGSWRPMTGSTSS
jgi:hypothetical protein